MTRNYAYNKVEASVSIEGFGEVGATNVSVTYGINMMPQASVELATGQIAGQGTGAGINVSKLAAYRRGISIAAKIGRGGVTTLFNGYVTGVSSKKSSGRFGVVVTGVGAQSDLASASPVASGLTRNAALYDLEKPTALPDLLGGGGPATYSYAGMQNTVEELVKGGFGAAFKTLALSLTKGVASGVPVNNSAAAGVIGSTEFMLNTLAGAPPAAITGLANTLASAMFTIFNGASLWEAMLAHTVELAYVVVPTVSKTFVIPWVPVSSGTAGTISDAYIVSVDNRFGIRPTVQTLILYQQEQAFTGVGGNLTTIQGSYTNPNVSSGMVDIAPMPSWLVNLFSTNFTGKTMTLADGIRGRCKSTGGAPSETVSKEVNDSVGQLSGAADQYAQFLYGLRSLNNVAIIQTSLDSRVGPGTNATFGLGDGLGSLDGYINTVTYMLDSERHMAVQQFTVSHMRSSADSAAIGTAGSPLWSGIVGGVNVIGNRTY